MTTTETAGGPRHHEADHLRAAGGRSLGRYALICHDPEGRGAATYWDSREEARQAEAELAPCGPRCGGVHTVVDRDPPPHHPAVLGLPRSLPAANH
ncbi:hypothetical protein A5773_04240 [Mycobacterium sp. 852014-52450_SCH5900713]|uniref:hypothetical protein n=1 Tax=Mycobacterium sp. 852014-52450_SCH5900713 TaxID=1834116 RepID=UPI0008004A98|nr:hypothetical protein [Mycobacterium sp. 852014-52450_SCH5900713]OBG00704.1 hypothetical protein A5773_04240 [Mycobacterium sp. 852014-52450_SCH5900713]